MMSEERKSWMDGLGLESLRLGGADAMRAENDLQMRGARSKADAPLKDLEDGAYRLNSVNYGFVAGLKNTEANTDRIKLEGYNVLRAVSVRSTSTVLIPERCQVYLTDNQGFELNILGGEVYYTQPQSWTGEIFLQGTWYVDARQWVNLATDHGNWLTVMSQRIMRGMEAGE